MKPVGSVPLQTGEAYRNVSFEARWECSVRVTTAFTGADSCMEGSLISYTPEQARQLAALLVEATDMADRLGGEAETVEGGEAGG